MPWQARPVAAAGQLLFVSESLKALSRNDLGGVLQATGNR
jgi:hypothetical protein